MASRGICTECRVLKPITRLSLELGSRVCDWAPVIHDVPDRHVECGAVVEYESRNRQLPNLDANGDPQFFEYYEARCALCGVLDDDADIARSNERCPGSRKPIR